ncbi:MAG: DUF4079 family protein [Thermodesulfovibrionales bacterium]
MKIDRETISFLRILHGLFNTTVMLMFFYQGCLGLKIRRNRERGELPLSKIVKRHRRLGPVLALFGVSGFLAGLTLVYLDYGDIMKYPIHLFVGLSIILLVAITFIISRKIKGLDSQWRTPHFRIGIIILALYCIQILLGLGLLL